MELPSHVRSRSMDTKILETFRNTPPSTPKARRTAGHHNTTTAPTTTTSNLGHDTSLFSAPAEINDLRSKRTDPSSHSTQQCPCCNTFMDNTARRALSCGHVLCAGCVITHEVRNVKGHDHNCPMCQRSVMQVIKCTVIGTAYKYIYDQLTSRLYDLQHDDDFQHKSQQIDGKIQDIAPKHNAIRLPPKIDLRFKFLIMAVLIICACLTMLAHTRAEGSGAARNKKVLRGRERPLDQWSVQEVRSWTISLGQWTHKALILMVEKSSIDGRKLRAMSKTHLYMSMSGYAVSEDDKAKYAEAVEKLVAEQDNPLIRNFWEYKEKQLARTLFMLYSMPRYTRLSVLYLYLFDYHSTFLPLLHLSNGQSFFTLTSSTMEEPTRAEKINFLIQWIFVPTLPIAQAMWRIRTFNKWLSTLVLVWASTVTVAEVYSIWYTIKFLWTLLCRSKSQHNSMPKDPTSKLSDIANNMFWFHTVLLTCYVCWSMIPAPLCTGYVYTKLFISVPLMIMSALLLQFLVVKNIFTCNQEKRYDGGVGYDGTGIDVDRLYDRVTTHDPSRHQMQDAGSFTYSSQDPHSYTQQSSHNYVQHETGADYSARIGTNHFSYSSAL